MQEGWICPKCGSVYSPSTDECWRCNKITCDDYLKDMKIISDDQTVDYGCEYMQTFCKNI